MLHFNARFLFVPFFIFFARQSYGQQKSKIEKPYKVLTSGRQLTINSDKKIHHIMLWTTNGDRVVEQKNINETNYTIRVPINRNAFFIMVGMADGKVYTEKIGIQ